MAKPWHERDDGHDLSGFERRCLFKRICEVHEVIQLALLGADAARDKALDPRELAVICLALEHAESQVALAEQLALRQLH
jgi:hypothetical protein